MNDFNFNYENEIFEGEDIVVRVILEFLSDKEDLLRWALPANAESLAVVIASGIHGVLTMRSGLHLAEGIEFIPKCRENILIPSLYARREIYKDVKGLSYGDEGFLFTKNLGEGETRSHVDYDIFDFWNSGRDNRRYGSKREYFVFDGAEDHESILSSEE